ncbi:MAG: cell division protein FtsH [bacterium (Candidatus Ratteibacteria) CG_4_9_14_3_um_filter_41_21]|uniref:ATP-dependent zinc metalloprotease FtsH n=4 Tax=Candidatus Ratteibacteria TaxID=2979319 RepID=A0A2M7YED2_9BACT|nr:MAG: cell division protein FtsH [Candidatus Omnitrophica bacterium CG1_02_41_171]PIV64229.1 MAG: cell division protein FtsH [bacterium (Candidatus Ratteibacteria) CG01_land_8_20_14_3_00_40_19]PIW32924.1 MAG: cell division protein FtsH [bacterium (Candidatus Ratteibacteria) CG15_BIG_FIL_POST_REV_8_21_14_020_41_12]PIW73896.1 MAG: cell division protein FtsH [bacterium (Candidatus Ratteibacteria) CG_4_8_14_3_um_filter_41_36]PJA61327.1 MAG: cell division protein FtsH [bacterium (Candidatus Rattei
MEKKKKKPENLKGNFAKGLIFWLLLGVFLFSLLKFSNLEEKKSPQKINDSEFFQQVESEEISGIVTIKGTTQPAGKFISGNLKDGKKFSTYTEDPNLYEFLKKQPNIKIYSQPESKSIWLNLLYSVLPIVLIFGLLWFFVARQVSKGGDRVLSFGKSRIVPLSESKQKITFADVAGLKEAKEELKEIIEFLKDPKKFQRLGGKIPKGVLLVGPPGTGKTLLAKAVSGEAGVPFLSMSGSDFVEMFVGVGASRVRDLFHQARQKAPAIVFIDEIDAVGRQRFAGLGGGHDEREQTLNQLLVEMDGFSTEEGVILMAATNRPDVLDPALVRRGRFDRQVVVTWPDIKEREGILKVHTKKIKLHPEVDLQIVARGTPGLSGADLALLANEAALLASRNNKESVEMDDFEEAKDKVMMGMEKKSLLISEKEKKIIAYHEAGHTLVQKFIPDANPIHKVTIIPRGCALGITHILPEEDTYIESNVFYQGELATLLAGRSAELLIFGKSYTGAENDLQIATELARKMVCEWGMSEKLGPITYRKRPAEVFLGRDLTQRGEHSEATSREIDQEVKSLIETAQRTAKEILEKNREKLEKIATALLEKETLTGEEINKIINGQEKN